MMDDILKFFSDNKNALTAIGILLTFLVSSASLYFSVRNNKAVHYVNSVTKSRIEWIQKVRTTVAEFVSMTNVYNNAYYKGDYDKSGEHLAKCKMLCTEIKLLLNCCDERDKEICSLTDEILEGHRKYCDEVHNMQVDKNGYFIERAKTKELKQNIENNLTVLLRKLHILLKAEWNRVKYESQGKEYEKDTQEFDIFELEQKYDNSNYKNKVWKRFCINVKAKVKRVYNSVPVIILMMCFGIVVVLAAILL